MKTDRIQERLEDSLEAIVDRIQDGLERGRYTWDEVHHAVADKSRRTARQTDAFVHEHSWEAIGVAALVGVAIGFLLNRR